MISLETIKEKIPFLDDSGSICHGYSNADCRLNGWRPVILITEAAGYGQKFDGYVVTAHLRRCSYVRREASIMNEYLCRSLQDVDDCVERIVSKIRSDNAEEHNTEEIPNG